MIRGFGGVVALAVTALLVCCSADPHSEQDAVSAGVHSSGDRYDANGHKMRNLDPLGGGNLVRAVRAARPLLLSHASLMPYLISRSDFNPYLVKRNFDEIDHTRMPFPYSKRLFRGYGNRDIDAPIEFMRSSYDKKRLVQGDFPMDEIDLSHFPIGSKRSQGYNFDNVIGFSSSGADQKRSLKRGGDYPMDEIDLSNFPVGSKRRFQGYNSHNVVGFAGSGADQTRSTRDGDFPMDEMDLSNFSIANRL